MKGIVVEQDEVTAAIRRCQMGDIGGLGPLIMHFQRPALHLAFLLTSDFSVAEDVVQDTFLQAFRAIQQFQPEKPFAPWLYRILTNVVRQRHRAHAARHEISLNQVLEHGTGADAAQVATHHHAPDPAEVVERDEVRAALLHALNELSPLLREVVVLRYYFGYTDGEVAEIVRCQPAAARKRLQNGLRALEHIIHERYAWLLNGNGASYLFTLPKEGLPHGTI